MKYIKDLSYLKNNIFAHRGLFDRTCPENTMGAFNNAIKNNIGIELDVHILKDNTIVVFHDDNLIRMAGIDLKLKDCVYDDIKKIKVGNSKYTIPKLDDVLKLVDGKVPIIIELKYDRKAGILEDAIFELLDRYNGWFCVKSFHPLHVRYVRKHRPDYIRGLLLSRKHSIQNVIATNSFIFKLLTKPDFLSCQKYLYKKRYVRKFKKRKPVLGWVIINKSEMNFYKKVYDSIIFEEN